VNSTAPATEALLRPYGSRIRRAAGTGFTLKPVEAAAGDENDLILAADNGAIIIAAAKLASTDALTFANSAATSGATVRVETKNTPFGIIGTLVGGTPTDRPSFVTASTLGEATFADTASIFRGSMLSGGAPKRVTANPFASGYVDITLADALDYRVIYPQQYVTLNAPVSDYVDFIYATPGISEAATATVVSAGSLPSWFSPVSSRIKLFSSLRDKWDSYRAKAISPIAIGRALDVAKLLAETVSRHGVPLTEPPFAAPMSSGGVLFEIKNRDRELHIEIDPAGSDRYDIYRMSGDEETEEDPINESGLPEVLSWIVDAR
jgi:hypothetical protein